MFIWAPGPFFIIMVENAITSLPPTLLANTTALVQFALSDNQLTTIPPAFFRPAPFLQLCLLKNNRLSELDTDIFAGNPRLSTLCGGGGLGVAVSCPTALTPGCPKGCWA